MRRSRSSWKRKSRREGPCHVTWQVVCSRGVGGRVAWKIYQRLREERLTAWSPSHIALPPMYSFLLLLLLLLILLLLSPGKKLSLAEVEAWINEADVDGNGTVDLEEFEHCTRKAFALSCTAQCTICCMNAMTSAAASSTSNSNSKSPKKPSSPPRGGSGGESMLKQRLRSQIRDRIKGSEQIKGLASSMFQTEMLHKELAQMTSGFRRTYSAPSPPPAATAAEFEENTHPESGPEESSQTTATGEGDKDNGSEIEKDGAAPAAPEAIKPSAPPPERFISAAEVALVCVGFLA